MALRDHSLNVSVGIILMYLSAFSFCEIITIKSQIKTHYLNWRFCASLMGGVLRNITRVFVERLWQSLGFVSNFAAINIIYYEGKEKRISKTWRMSDFFHIMKAKTGKCYWKFTFRWIAIFLMFSLYSWSGTWGPSPFGLGRVESLPPK